MKLGPVFRSELEQPTGVKFCSLLRIKQHISCKFIVLTIINVLSSMHP